MFNFNMSVKSEINFQEYSELLVRNLYIVQPMWHCIYNISLSPKPIEVAENGMCMYTVYIRPSVRYI